MNLWFLIPAGLGMAVTLAVWTALRLLVWSRATQNIAGALTLLGIAGIMVGYLYQLVMPDYETAQFWIRFQGIGFNLLYPAWFIFILYLTGNERRVTPLLIFLLTLLSAIPLVFLFNPATSSWFIQTRSVVSVGPFKLYQQQLGWMAVVNGLIGQVEGIISSVLLLRELSRIRSAYKTRIGALFCVLVLIFITGWMEISGANPVAPFSPIALSMIPICIVVCWVLFSLRVGQILPMIRERVVENMRDGVLVIDAKMKVAYLNPAAARRLRLLNHPAMLRPQTGFLLHDLSPELTASLEAQPISDIERDVEDTVVSLGEMIYNVSRSILEDWKGKIIGQVLVLHNITDQDRLEKALQARASDLARSSAFTEALSLVAAKVAASADINQVFRTLSQELDRIGIHFCVALRMPGQTGYSIKYISLSPAIIQLIEKQAGVMLWKFPLPEFELLAQTNAVVEDGAIYYSHVLQPVKMLFNNVPDAVMQPLLTAADIKQQTASFVFRLASGDEETGIFCVWSEALRNDDLSSLSVFAAQVSAAIQKARLIESEHHRVAELERSNRFITALSQVAACFEADLNLEQIMQTIGTEMHNLNAECLIALIDPGTEELVGRYTSVSTIIWQACEKISRAKLEDFRIPYNNWRALNPNSNSPAMIIENPVEFASKVMRTLPKGILRQTIRMIGITASKPALWIPLSARGRNIGILIIWGIPQPQEYLPAITLFARQAASAIEKARLTGELEKLKSFNEGIVQGVAESIIILDSSERISFINPAAAQMFGVNIEELIGQSWQKFIPISEQNKSKQILEKITAKNEVGIELNVLRQNGTIIPVLANIQPRFVDGQVESTLISLVDIEQRVVAEQQIRASIQEKEAMLKEIHHRVKNNLQIVSSLLNLQSNQLKDEKSIEFFRESQTRIRSMALIHEKLYRSDNLARIQFDEYIRELVSFLLHTYSDNTRSIQLEVQADPINLDLDTAIPCSLIINELVSNSLKYGFPPGHPMTFSGSGRIFVKLARYGESQLQLIVEDNGAGFPPDIDFLKTKSLGLQLVNSLTRQLDGEVCFSNQPGARVEINFSAE